MTDSFVEYDWQVTIFCSFNEFIKLGIILKLNKIISIKNFLRLKEKLNKVIYFETVVSVFLIENTVMTADWIARLLFIFKGFIC